MKHVTDRLAAWVGGELDGPSAAALEAHLQECGDCRREAEGLRVTWSMLDLAAAAPAAPRAASVWPAVQGRTFGARQGGWFFGRGPAMRLALAGATLFVGILGGRLAGGLAGPRAALAEDDGLVAVWLEDSTMYDGSGGGLAASWLAVADEDGAAATDGSAGGAK